MMKKEIKKIGRRLNITVDEWSELVAEFHQSKLTLHDFAKNKGINPYTFRYWAYDRARLRKNKKTKGKQVNFIEVSAPVKKKLALDIRMPNGIEMSFTSLGRDDIECIIKEVAKCLD